MPAASDILLPAMALVGWTLMVLLLIPYRRLRAAFAGTLTPDDFRFGESGRVPGEVSIPNRNYMNLLEVPVLFHVLCLTAFVTARVDATAVLMAWSYVGMRVLHSVIHLSYNKVIHRLLAFALSNVVLFLLWIRLTVDLVRSGST